MSQIIQRFPAIKGQTGLSRSTIYAYIKSGDFPKPILLGARAVGWLQSEVDEWLERRIQVSQSKDAFINRNNICGQVL